MALAETLLAGWGLAEAGLDVPEGVLALAPVRVGDRLTLHAQGTVSGIARAVPHAGEVSMLVLVLHDQLLTFRPGDWTAAPRGTDMGGERADLAFDAARPEAMADFPGGGDALLRMGAVARACTMAGALETALKITVDYTQEREAFGRKIGKFQALQQNLAVMAGEVAAGLIRPPTTGGWAPPPPRSASARPSRRALPSPTRRMAPSAGRRTTRCSASPAACGAGATISARRPTGRCAWAATSRRRAPSGCGRC